MDALTISAASGLRARMETLDMLANNLANASTGGFKFDREFYSLYVSPEARASAAWATAPATVPVIEKQLDRFFAGHAHAHRQSTGSGALRQGILHRQRSLRPALHAQRQLPAFGQRRARTTAEGYPCAGAGSASTIQSQSGSPLEVTPRWRGAPGRPDPGQTGTARLSRETNLSSSRATTTSVPTDPKVKPAPATAAQVEQGKIESSNVSSAEWRRSPGQRDAAV